MSVRALRQADRAPAPVASGVDRPGTVEIVEHGRPAAEGLPGGLAATSYALPDDLDYERWVAIGLTLQQMERSVGFWVGDWWNHGERRWGEQSAQAIKDATGHERATVWNYAYVCRSIEPSRRREELSFSHRYEVATPVALDAEQVVICEAPIDALSLAACGVPAVALCGTSRPDWLAAACAFLRVALAFDADGAGDKAAADLAPSLRSFGATVERWRPDGVRDWKELLVRRGVGGVLDETMKGGPR